MRLDVHWLTRVAVLLGIKWRGTQTGVTGDGWINKAECCEYLRNVAVLRKKRGIQFSRSMKKYVKECINFFAWPLNIWSTADSAVLFEKGELCLGGESGFGSQESKARAPSVAWVNGGYIAQREWEQTRKLLERGRESRVGRGVADMFENTEDKTSSPLSEWPEPWAQRWPRCWELPRHEGPSGLRTCSLMQYFYWIFVYPM